MKIVFLVMFIFASSIASASVQSECKSAESSLEKFIRLDSGGETLHTSKKLDAVIYYNGRDTGGYDTVSVVDSSAIRSCSPKGSGLEIKVAYQVVGEFSGVLTKQGLDKVLAAHPIEKLESFYLVKEGKDWKIDSPSVPQPHVNIETARKLVQ